jgi:DNA-binding NarL/FixJ family response regulator
LELRNDVTSPHLPGTRILLVEADRAHNSSLRRSLALHGCVVVASASTASDAVEIVGRQPIDLVLIDEAIGAPEAAFLRGQLTARGLPFLLVIEADRAGTEPQPSIGRSDPPAQVGEAVARALASKK